MFFVRREGSGVKRKVSRVQAVVGDGPDGGGEKYDRILDAAVTVIAENGYFNSPVSAIAARAGVADGTVYLYFKSKDDVLRTALNRNFDRFFVRVAERFETLDGAMEQLEFVVWLHLSSAEIDRSMTILMQTEIRQSAKFIAEFSIAPLTKYIQLLRQILRKGKAEGVFRSDMSDGVMAHCLFGAIDEMLSSTVFTGRKYEAKETAAQVIDVMLHGIGKARGNDHG